VRVQVEMLASHERLSLMSEEIKTEFKDVFQPIPHVDELPNEVRCKIKLKDAGKTIAT
jgi:hypothetical protein